MEERIVRILWEGKVLDELVLLVEVLHVLDPGDEVVSLCECGTHHDTASLLDGLHSVLGYSEVVLQLVLRQQLVPTPIRVDHEQPWQDEVLGEWVLVASHILQLLAIISPQHIGSVSQALYGGGS